MLFSRIMFSATLSSGVKVNGNSMISGCAVSSGSLVSGEAKLINSLAIENQ